MGRKIGNTKMRKKIVMFLLVGIMLTGCAQKTDVAETTVEDTVMETVAETITESEESIESTEEETVSMESENVGLETATEVPDAPEASKQDEEGISVKIIEEHNYILQCTVNGQEEILEFDKKVQDGISNIIITEIGDVTGDGQADLVVNVPWYISSYMAYKTYVYMSTENGLEEILYIEPKNKLNDNMGYNIGCSISPEGELVVTRYSWIGDDNKEIVILKYENNDFQVVSAHKRLTQEEYQRLAHEYVVVEKAQDYREQMYDRAVVYEMYEDRIWELINENPIDKKYSLGPNLTTEGRIENAVNYRDSWRAEIEYALQILQPVMGEEQYNQLVASYEGWKVYMESLHSVEMDYYYNGGIIGGLEYPHVIEVEATRTKDYAVSLLALEYVLTWKIDYVFDN